MPAHPPRATERRTYDLLADLRLCVEGCVLEPLQRTVSRGFDRHTTVVRLSGAGCQGRGEDVTYEADDQRRFQRSSFDWPVGEFSLAEFSVALDRIDLFPAAPAQQASRDYRRWAVESAALDLALRQAETSLAARLGREPAPTRFVVSLGLGGPPTIAPLRRLLRAYPQLRFKLDANPSWDQALVRDLATMDRIDVVDFKGAYRGTVVDQPADLDLYDRVADTLPRVWLEDPAATSVARAFVERHRDRIAWDAPIHSVADIEALEFLPRVINMKPSRFGRLSALFDAYDYCRARGIDMYGGGQFELGPGRGQIQYLAALFHPSACNDVAPGGYNVRPLSPDLPITPLAPPRSAVGFARESGAGESRSGS